MKENYLAKWLNKELTEAELAELRKMPEYASYKHIIEALDSAQAPDFDVESALADLQSRKTVPPVKVVRLNPWNRILKVAAVLVLIFGLSLIYINTLDETVTAEYAQRSEVILPDASEIVLNSGSEIHYDKRNWANERKVSLKGEAFFKVAKGQKFTVETPDGQVTVLGTQFNVENRNGYFEVSCFEGLVRVDYQGTARELPAGTAFLVINGRIIDREGPDADAPSWLNNESSFRSTPLGYVLDEFKRQYDLEVETRNVDLKQLYTGTFSNTNINLALQSISTPSQISFKLEGNKVLFYAEDTP